VPDQTPERVRQLVEDHIRRQGFFIVSHTPSMEERRRHPKIVRLAWGPGYPPARTSMDLPIAQLRRQHPHVSLSRGARCSRHRRTDRQPRQ
jgi:hypothetical protein